MRLRPLLLVGLCCLLVTAGCQTSSVPEEEYTRTTTTMPDPLYEQSITDPPHPETKSKFDMGLDVTRIERLVAEKINEYRQEHNYSAFTYDPELADIARYHSWEMANYSYFAHDSPVDGDGHENWLRQFNYKTPGYTAENIAVSAIGDYLKNNHDTGEAIAEQIFQMWRTSDSHRRAMLHEYAIQGVGIYIKEDGGYYASLILVDDEPATDGALDP